MLYTALTRAKKRVIIVFIDDALEDACLRKTENNIIERTYFTLYVTCEKGKLM